VARVVDFEQRDVARLAERNDELAQQRVIARPGLAAENGNARGGRSPLRSPRGALCGVEVLLDQELLQAFEVRERLRVSRIGNDSRLLRRAA